MRILTPARAMAVAALLTGCAAPPEPPKVEAKAAAAPADAGFTSHASGLKLSDTRVGTGAVPRPGQTCVMHYTGWLYQNGKKGAKFDSSLDRGRPFEFQLGQGRVIKGWEEGIATMKVGGQRTLVIPPDLAYGAGGTPGIPPHSTLLFEVELLAVRDSEQVRESE